MTDETKQFNFVEIESFKEFVNVILYTPGLFINHYKIDDKRHLYFNFVLINWGNNNIKVLYYCVLKNDLGVGFISFNPRSFEYSLVNGSLNKPSEIIISIVNCANISFKDKILEIIAQ